MEIAFQIACYDRWYCFKKIHDVYKEKPSLLYPELIGTLKFWEEENRRTYPPQKKTLKQGENQEQTQPTSDTVTGGRRSLSPLSSSDPADKVC